MTDILNWVKAHWLIVFFCVIILGATPAGIFLGGNSSATVRDKVSSRVRATETSLQNVERTSVTIQSLHPDVASYDQQMVITEKILDEYRNIRQSIKEDADEILGTAEEINRADHYEQLVPGLLPIPRVEDEQALPYQINPAYWKAHENLLTYLNAGDPISDEILGDTLSDFQGTYIRTQLGQEVDDTLEDEDQERLDAAMTTRRMLEYRQHAEGISVYADLSIFNLQDWNMERGAPSPGMWFDWQHAYWVNQDIVKAINAANAPDQNAGGSGLDSISGQPGSTVKRIINIQLDPMFDVRAKQKVDEFGGGGFEEGEAFDMGRMEGGTGMGEGGGGPSRGKGMGGEAEYTPRGTVDPRAMDAGISNDDASKAFEDDFAVSISGRSPNPLYDVRRLTLTVVADSNRLPRLINAIQQTNFMTVTGCKLHKINSRSHMIDGYYYGQGPVVQVVLEIETLWLRDWTTPFMPDDVKTALGIPLDDEEG